MQAEYDGRQIVGIDLHRRRSVIVRMTETGERLDSVRIANDPMTLAAEIAKAVVLTLFIPLIMSSGGNSGSQATSLIVRALAVAAGALVARCLARIADRHRAGALSWVQSVSAGSHSGRSPASMTTASIGG